MVSTKPGFSGSGVIMLFSLLFCLKFSFKRQLERTNGQNEDEKENWPK